MHTCYTAIGAASELCMPRESGSLSLGKKRCARYATGAFCRVWETVLQRIGAVRDAHQSGANAWSCV
jgi:hypothetical protein